MFKSSMDSMALLQKGNELLDEDPAFQKELVSQIGVDLRLEALETMPDGMGLHHFSFLQIQVIHTLNQDQKLNNKKMIFNF